MTENLQLEISMTDFWMKTEILNRYAAKGKGPLSSCLWSGYGLWSTTGNHSYPNIIYEQWAQGGNGVSTLRGDLLAAPIIDKEVKDVDSVSAVVSLGVPHSYGSVKIASADPFEQPDIDFNFFTDPDGKDFEDLVIATKFIVNFYEGSKSYGRYGMKLFGKNFPGCTHYEFKSDDYYKCYVKMVSCEFSIFT